MAGEREIEICRNGEPTGKFITEDSVDGEKYGFCRYCDNDYAIPAEELESNNGMCVEHRDEFEPVDEEDAEDQASYAEYMNKNY